MRIALLTIGSELLNGKVKEANTYILGKKLRTFNAQLVLSLSVSDNPDKIISACSYALSQAELLIVSGGLGPTRDDITLEVLTKEFGVSSSIKNHNGSAQGARFHDVQLYATPGVPREFEMMISKEILPSLQIHINKQEHLVFKTFGMNETKIFEQLAPTLWNDLSRYGSVSCLPQLGGVNIGVYLKDKSQKSFVIEQVKKSELNSILYHIGEEELEEVLVSILSRNSLTLATAESCTGGLIASKITNVSGSSAVFMGSVIAYANDVKVNELAVSESDLKSQGAVSEKVAKQMAEGVRLKMGTSIGVSTTGIAGPGGGSENKPVGTVWVGVSTRQKTWALQYQFRGDRQTLKERFARTALFNVLRYSRCLQ